MSNDNQQRLSRTDKGYAFSVVFTFEDLADDLPLEAEAAILDISQVYKECEYLVVENGLYGRSFSPPTHHWWYFDRSVRRWQLCDDPTKDNHTV